MKWISVDDNLPEELENVLVGGHGYEPDKGYIADGIWYDQDAEPLNSITHWMFLPDPPKAD